MSLSRRRSATDYRYGYLHSRTWFSRRDRWFVAERAARGSVRCELCGIPGDTHTLELHHLDYSGVLRYQDGSWSALEPHDDLIALHRQHHEWVHRLIDRDRALARMGSRRNATAAAITRLRDQLIQVRQTKEQP